MYTHTTKARLGGERHILYCRLTYATNLCMHVTDDGLVRSDTWACYYFPLFYIAKDVAPSIMSTVAALKEQLLSQIVADFVIFTPVGEVVERSGDFAASAQKCQSAYLVIQQCSGLMRAQEKLKRVTVTFDDAVYVATVATLSGKPHGVVVKRQPPPTQ
jgi:hypothetical protein